MNYLSTAAELQEGLSFLDEREWTVVQFFFDFRSDQNIANNIEGLMRSLLIQILETDDNIWNALFSPREIRRELRNFKSMHVTRLSQLLTKALVNTEHNLLILVDGLDEYADDLSALVEICRLLSTQRTQASAIVKCCFASRPKPWTTDLFRNDPQLRLQDHNVLGLTNYVNASISQYLRSPLEGKMARELVHEIVRRAEGMFIWARFAVSELMNIYLKGENISHVRTRLQDLPSELYDLYSRHFRGMNASEISDARLLLRLIVKHGSSRLNFHQLFVAFSHSRDKKFFHTGYIDEASRESFWRRVQYLLGNLVEGASIKQDESEDEMDDEEEDESEDEKEDAWEDEDELQDENHNSLRRRRRCIHGKKRDKSSYVDLVRITHETVRAFLETWDDSQFENREPWLPLFSSYLAEVCDTVQGIARADFDSQHDWIYKYRYNCSDQYCDISEDTFVNFAIGKMYRYGALLDIQPRACQYLANCFNTLLWVYTAYNRKFVLEYWREPHATLGFEMSLTLAVRLRLRQYATYLLRKQGLCRAVADADTDLPDQRSEDEDESWSDRRSIIQDVVDHGMRNQSYLFVDSLIFYSDIELETAMALRPQRMHMHNSGFRDKPALAILAAYADRIPYYIWRKVGVLLNHGDDPKVTCSEAGPFIHTVLKRVADHEIWPNSRFFGASFVELLESADFDLNFCGSAGSALAIWWSHILNSSRDEHDGVNAMKREFQGLVLRPLIKRGALLRWPTDIELSVLAPTTMQQVWTCERLHAPGSSSEKVKEFYSLPTIPERLSFLDACADELGNGSEDELEHRSEGEPKIESEE